MAIVPLALRPKVLFCIVENVAQCEVVPSLQKEVVSAACAYVHAKASCQSIFELLLVCQPVLHNAYALRASLAAKGLFVHLCLGRPVSGLLVLLA